MSTKISKAPPKSMFHLETDQWSKPFWDAAAEHRLVACRCGKCGTFRMPPSPFCHACQSQEVEWVQLSGEGRIYTYSIVDFPVIPQVKDNLPYIPAVIEFPEADGVRLISNIVEAPVDAVKIGAEVSVLWEDHEPGVSLPRFTLKQV